MTNTRALTDIYNDIIKWFEEHEEEFNDCIEELDAYNGYLSDDRYYYMEELNEIYSNEEPSEILTRAFYGYDEDGYIVNYRGEKENGPFNPNRDYFRFNGYGNLVSADYKDYGNYLDEYAVIAMSDNRQYIDTIEEHEELSKLFDELENFESEV